jgi:hypothetical protein
MITSAVEKAVEDLQAALVAEKTSTWTERVAFARLALDVELIVAHRRDAKTGKVDPFEGLPAHAFGVGAQNPEDLG